MDEILTNEQLKDHFVKICNEGKEYFADSSKELKYYFIQKSNEGKRK